MHGLFYSNSENILFYITSYYCNGTGTVNNLIQNLNKGIAELRKYEPDNEIYASEVLASRWCKSKWLYHVRCAIKPKDAFGLGLEWTMSKWIAN